MAQRQAGDTIEGIFRLGEDPYVIVPVTVVRDDPDCVAHSIPFGTAYLIRTFPDGSALPRVMTIDEFQAYETVLSWKHWKRHALVTVGPGAAHAIRAWWSEDWTFGGWYVNLQQPLQRTATGFITEDHFLDILVSPDLSWRWKDEDELELAVERGRVSAGQSRAIRDEGERVVRMIECSAFPFDGSLTEWRPDPAWPVPVLESRWTR